MECLYRDRTVVVVDKPSGWLTHPGGGAEAGAKAALQAARDLVGAWVWPVHRLDRGASGALAFALSPEDARWLHQAFERGEVDKRYLALVRGAPPAEAVVEHAIPRREGGPRVPALTRVRCVEIVEVEGPAGRPQAYALVEARPATGRLHQVRRHLKHLGHPLLGDVNYGRGEHNRHMRERFGLGRLALHAASLAWTRPEDGARVEVRAPLPADLAEPMRAMGFRATAAA